MNKTVIWTAEREIKYAELFGKNHDFAKLCPLEGRGSRVVIFSENRTGVIYAFYGVWHNRGIAVPVDHSSSATDLAYVLKDCEPLAIFTSDKLEERARQAIEIAGGDQRVIVIDKDLEESPATSEPVMMDNDDKDTALIIYTSGTTGSPKGVMLTFENVRSNIWAVSEDVPIYSEKQRTMMLLPIHHILPLMASIIAPIMTGGSIAICPGMSAPELMSTLHDAKVTMIIGVPRLYTMIAKGIYNKIKANFVARMLYRLCDIVESYRFSRIVFNSVHKKMGGNVQYLVCGGAALDPAIGKILKVLGLKVLEGYGMTETAPMVTFTKPNDIVIGAAGTPLRRCSVEIRDGEVCVKGTNVMKGYFNRPEETAQVIDPDGWLHTGDLGYLDNCGRLFLTGRKKEIIVLSNGKNVNPVDIEQQLESYAAYIKEAAVTDKDDALIAIAVPAQEIEHLSDAEIEEKFKWEVLDKYNADAAAYKKIFNIKLYRGDLPRTRLEKLQRFKLKELLEGDKQEATESCNNGAEGMSEDYKILKAYIEEEKHCHMRPTDHIELDLAFDSLDKVGLQVFVNSTFGLDVSTDQLVGFRSVEAMASYITDCKTKVQVEKIDWKKILREHTTLKLPKTWFTGRLFVALSQPFLRIYFKLTGKGMENLPDGPVIIAPNHQSFLDGLFVLSFIKSRTIKNTYFYAKQAHVRRPFVKFIAATHNVIVMDMSNLKDSIQKLGEALKKRKNLIIFPEGTRTTDGKLGEFKKTFAILSKELDVPVVPVSIKGAFEALPKGKKMPRPRKVVVDFLKPIYPNQDSDYEGLTHDVYSSIKQNQETTPVA